jgi:ATP-dependent 26S proteasome regulatory subunit
MNNNIDHNNWSAANQQYLTAMLKIIRAQLEKFNKAGNGDETGDEYFVSIEELRNQANGMTAPPAIERLVNNLALSAFERDILLLCAGMELDAALGEQIVSMEEEKFSVLPSFSLALAAFPQSHWSATAPSGPLRYWRLIEINKAQLITKSPLKIDEHILHYLVGINELHERLREIAYKVITTDYLLPSQYKLAKNIYEILNKKKEYHLLPVVQVLGKDQSGKLSIAGNISAWMELELYTISAYNIPLNHHDNTELARLWSREAALNGYALCLDCSDLDVSDKTRTQAVTSFIENVFGLVMINSVDWVPELRKTSLVLNVQKPVRQEQLSLWQKISGTAGHDIEKLGLQDLISQFNLSADTITKVSQEVFYSGLNGMESDPGQLQRKLWKTCSNYTRPQVDELAQRIEPLADWDDIILPEEQKNTLRAIAAQVRHRNKVYEEWGFARKISRGLGISVLFAGESGTGKTMAAEVMANDLQLELYKIDLSKVVNKYIGETEKNLKKIFDAAEDGGAILLFDEADALFGKRSEVKDSHDRYSNIEVSYLLQRMEAYSGLAILTTNMKNALDKAFLRRIRFVVPFPFPDAVHRSLIWKKVFPAAAKQNLDLDKLARLNLAGGSIRNIALNAAFFAASDGDEILMSHISKAAKSEYDKLEKTFTSF